MMQSDHHGHTYMCQYRVSALVLIRGTEAPTGQVTSSQDQQYLHEVKYNKSHHHIVTTTTTTTTTYYNIQNTIRCNMLKSY